MDEFLTSRRSKNDERLESLKQHLNDAKKHAGDVACVYLTGSFARGEASDHSDLDLFIVGDKKEDGATLSNLDAICLKADLIEKTREMGFPEFSGDGEYLKHYSVADLIGALGKPDDDASNTFTARLLLLLESRALLGARVYEKTIGDVIAAYWRDYEDHKSDFMPTFLANDITRLWRTFCVNYEARTQTDPPKEGEAKTQELQA
jgi:predicted nucleotidyltransferase